MGEKLYLISAETPYQHIRNRYRIKLRDYCSALSEKCWQFRYVFIDNDLAGEIA